MLEDKSYLPDLMLTTTDEKIIRRTEKYQTGLARHYYGPAMTLLLVFMIITGVMTFRLVTRLAGLATAEHISFLQAFSFHVPISRPLNTNELGILSAASTVRAAILGSIFAVAAPVLLAAYHSQNILILKLWNALQASRGARQ